MVWAAGQLIRSADDTGVIALLERRFLQTSYADRLPEPPMLGGGNEALTGDPAEVAAEFFGVR